MTCAAAASSERRPLYYPRADALVFSARPFPTISFQDQALPAVQSFSEVVAGAEHSDTGGNNPGGSH